MDDRAGVAAAALDYFEGWFDGDVQRLERALHPDLAKRAYTQAGIGKDRMVALTAAGEGKAEDPGERRIEVDVVDLHSDIASAVVRSAVYREYLHLVRTDGGWKIINALWALT